MHVSAMLLGGYKHLFPARESVQSALGSYLRHIAARVAVFTATRQEGGRGKQIARRGAGRSKIGVAICEGGCNQANKARRPRTHIYRALRWPENGGRRRVRVLVNLACGGSARLSSWVKQTFPISPRNVVMAT